MGRPLSAEGQGSSRDEAGGTTRNGAPPRDAIWRATAPKPWGGGKPNRACRPTSHRRRISRERKDRGHDNTIRVRFDGAEAGHGTLPCQATRPSDHPRPGRLGWNVRSPTWRYYCPRSSAVRWKLSLRNICERPAHYSGGRPDMSGSGVVEQQICGRSQRRPRSSMVFPRQSNALYSGL
jgi:hypothetical protein